MRILILSQWFTPEPFLKGLKFAKGLVERGHQVQVLTGFPNYPGGKIYPGYTIRLLQRETLDGVPILRVPLFPSHDGSVVRRVCNYSSFALSAALLGCPRVDKADVVYTYHPPATIALPALVIRMIRRIPFIYDIQDLWPDTLRATGMVQNPMVLKAIGLWCQMTYRYASKIVAQSPGFKKELANRGVPREKIEIIYNWCSEDEIFRSSRDEGLAHRLGMAGKFNVVFAGTMGKAQDLETVLGAAEILKERVARVQIVLIGGGIEVEGLKRSANRKRLTNVVFLAQRPRSEIAEVLNLADVLLVHLRKDPLFRITIPSKIGAYLSVGRPILVAVEGDAADLVLQAGAGIACEPGSPGLLAETIEKMAGMPEVSLTEMGDHGRKFYLDELSFRKGIDKFERVFHQAAKLNLRTISFP